MFKYEMHLHSRLTSACAVSDSTEYVTAAVEKGYAGIVFTNHFTRGNTAVDKTLPWKKFVECYKKDWQNAKELGTKLDIDVLFGVEAGYGGGKECLIYGISPQTFAAEKDFPQMPLSEISAFVRENRGFIAAAHPFRRRSYISAPDCPPDHELFDGIEVYNRANSEEENHLAMEFAVHHGLVPLSGGDIHNARDFGFSGIVLPQRVKNGKQLANALKKHHPKLIVDVQKENFNRSFTHFLYSE